VYIVRALQVLQQGVEQGAHGCTGSCFDVRYTKMLVARVFTLRIYHSLALMTSIPSTSSFNNSLKIASHISCTYVTELLVRLLHSVV
jgi:L-cystine uptake protein TcyP (sodium:dicarboxylate symporter family)